MAPQLPSSAAANALASSSPSSPESSKKKRQPSALQVAKRGAYECSRRLAMAVRRKQAVNDETVEELTRIVAQYRELLAKRDATSRLRAERAALRDAKKGAEASKAPATTSA